ncbi:MAG: hypothetical protein HQL07_00570 [Nitrospirae bacterium]|nr:hypothetical protein [Magnetococcales bacterium]
MNVMRIVKALKNWWNQYQERRKIIWAVGAVPGIGFDGVMRLVGDKPDRNGLRDNIGLLIKRDVIVKDDNGHYWPL